MTNPNSLIVKARGLNTQPNELDVPEGSLTVAENVEVTRDNVVQVSPGFADYSANLPDFQPAQLFAFGGTPYLHLDNGIWYHDGSNWLRKRGSFGASFSSFKGVWIDPNTGTSYITSHSCVLSMDGTGAIFVLAGRLGSSGSTDGTGDSARFNSTMGFLWGDGTNLYVADNGNHTIRKVVVSTGVVTTLAGTAGASGTTNDTGSAARFNAPWGIWGDGTNLYVTDSGNHSIRKIVISSGVVTTFAGTSGSSGTTDDIGSAARFNGPTGLWGDGDSLFVCDLSNHSIRKVVLFSDSAATATVTTLAGLSGTSGSSNGTGSAARFFRPTGIWGDGTNLYVTENSNHLVRRIVSSSAAVTTVAGTAAGTGFADGIGTSASFNTPLGVWGTSEYLTVCDSLNRMLRRVYTDTGYVSTVSGGTSFTLTSLSTRADGIVVGPS